MKLSLALILSLFASAGFLAESAQAVTVKNGIYRQKSEGACDIRAHFQGDSVAIEFIDNPHIHCAQPGVIHASWDSKRRAYCTKMESNERFCFSVPHDLLIRQGSRDHVYTGK